MKLRVIFLCFLFLCGCSDSFEADRARPSENSAQSPDPTPAPNPAPEDPGLKICSKLDFSNIRWPQNMSEDFQNSFALALNITSSFEGPQSWSTLAGDSDGQGISLGLLQQNLGSNTLQPLLSQMKTSAPNRMKSFFAESRWLSLKNMIEEWERLSLKSFSTSESDLLFAQESDTISLFDTDSFAFKATNSNAVQKSLSWARSTALNGKKVRPEWQVELQKMASSSEYKNLQFLESLTLHNKTERYRQYFEFGTLEAYLFLFDIVVQNGGFKKSHQDQYQQKIRENPRLTEPERLQTLLKIRLESVRPQYRNDVLSRKNTILTGRGVVHGSQRNLPKEYCYQSQVVLWP